MWHELDVFTADQKLRQLWNIYYWQDTINTLDKQHQNCKKYGKQGTNFLTDRNTKFVYSIWLEKTEWKKIWQARIHDSGSLKTPVHSRLPYTFGVFWKYGFLKMFFFKKKTISWRTEIPSLFTALIRKHRIEENLASKDTSLQFTQDSRSPFGAFWTYGFKKKKKLRLNHCYCMRCGVLLIPTTVSSLNINLNNSVLWHCNFSIRSNIYW